MTGSVGYIVPHSAGPPPVSNNQLLDQAIQDGEGRTRVAKLIMKILTVAKAAFSAIPESLTQIYISFKGFFSVVEIFSLLNTIKFWICDFKGAVMTWQKTASKVCGTIGQLFDFASLLESFGAFKLSEVASKIGYTPLFSVFGGAFSILSSTFSLWQDVEEKKDVDQRIVSVSNRIISLKAISARLPVRLKEEYDQKDDAKTIAERRAEFIKEAALADREIVVLTKQLQDLKTDRIKNWMSIAKNVAAIALSILILIGAIFSVGCLASSGLPMVIISLALAAYGVFTYLYDKANPTQPRPALVAAA